MLFQHSCDGQRPLANWHLYLHAYFFSLSAPAIKKVPFQSSERGRFCLYYMNLMLGIQGQDLKLSCHSLLRGENCRLNGVSDLVQPVYSSYWSAAGLLTEFCNNRTASASSLHTCVHMSIVCSCFLLLSLNTIATSKSEQVY